MTRPAKNIQSEKRSRKSKSKRGKTAGCRESFSWSWAGHQGAGIRGELKLILIGWKVTRFGKGGRYGPQGATGDRFREKVLARGKGG